MNSKRQIESFSSHEIITAQAEIIRCLLLLLMGKNMVSESEVMLMAGFAKHRLQSFAHQELVKRACAYIDHLLKSLEPDAGMPPQERQ
jgi:hypothetical protein